MEISVAKQQEYMRRILIARMAALSHNGFFGLLLMHMKFALDESVETAATDGEKIYFAPSFLDELSDSELVFILMHEIMHIVLKHVFRENERDNLVFNVACDIVVNSNILQAADMDERSISITGYGVSMHKAPDGREGFNYTAEEVYDMLMSGAQSNRVSGKQTSEGNNQLSGKGSLGHDDHGMPVDDHSRWGSSSNKELEIVWNNHIREAYDAAQSNGSGGGKGRGVTPSGVERQMNELMHPMTDWRVILNDFVQEEIVDYSFTPPDRRLQDSPFFLPDYNETEAVVKNVLFMIDTSGSMSEEEITKAYSEIKGAIDQFGGRLEGWLGFFDAKVIPPEPFADVNEFKIIRPKGGGGTDFGVIFDYVSDSMSDLEIASIIIMTDGFAPFPPERVAMGIPVLWMINNDNVTPPWGRIARI